jgi:hypothetical protein
MFAQWPIVAADLHSEYGIDAADRDLMRSRSWRWLAARLDGLAMRESRIVAWAIARHKNSTA